MHLEDIQLHNLPQAAEAHPEQVVALTEALAQLDATHPQWADMIRHRFYGGLTMAQTARAMNVSERTARRWWNQARVILHDEILDRLSTVPTVSCAR